MRVEVRAVVSVEPDGLAVLASEELHDAHAGEAFLQERVDPGQPGCGCPGTPGGL